MIKKTYIPAKPRSSKLVGTSMSGGVAGSVSSSSAGSTDPNSHSHPNKRILDTITQEVLDNALREMLGVESTEEVTDENFFSALRTLKEILDNNETLKDLFLSKLEADTAKGKITFEQGLVSQALARLVDIQFGDFQSGMHTGQGGAIDSAGNAELESLVLRSFLEVPTIRFNELEYIGEEIIIGAGAVLKGVEHLGDDRYRLTLKLEDGQFNPFRPSDLLKGIYNMDEDGNFTGFGTTYVSVSSIDEHEMIVILADESDVVGNRNMPPRKFMHLARIGNFIDEDRQSYISLSAKDRAITQYGGVNAFAKKNKQGKNVRAGVVTTQWGRAEGLEFIENFDNLPITKDSDVLYTDTLLYNKQIKVDYKGIVIKEYIDRGQWFEGMECQVTETTIDEVWIEAEKFRLIDRPIADDAYITTEKPTRESEDWMLILSLKEEIYGHAPIIRDGYWYEWNPALEGEDKYQNTGVRAEGIKGDGAIEKFKSSATQPSTPTGEAEDWDDEPTAFQYSTLVPVGNNLYDRNYLIQRGWTNYSGYVGKNLTSAGENLINPSLFKPNKQYIFKGRIDGDSAGSFLDINYTTGSKKTIMMTPGTTFNETTDKDRSVASIVVRQFWVLVMDGVTLFELDMGEVKNLPIWAARKTIKDGVESAWSTPVKWSGEDGEKGKDGTGINVVGSADTWNSLPTSGNNLNDARIVQDTGVLAVWDGTKWVEAGEIKGPAGDTPYIGGNGNWWIGSTDTGIKAKGDKGDKGDGVRILGSFNTPSELSGVSNPAVGDGYMINGDLWVYVGGSIHTPPAPVGWNNVGRIQGEKGKDGSSYLVLGYWSPDYEYQQSDAGIPIVKRPGSATFLAYKLIVPKSTAGQFINTGTNKEWELVDSSEFTYMLEAYIEVLQAELVTAEKIEALDITVRKLKTPSTEVTTANFQSQIIQANSVIIQDQGSTPVTYDWNTVYLPNGAQYDGLKAQIYAPAGTYKRIRIKTSDGGLLYINNTEVAVGKIELAFLTRATIHLTAMWNPTYNVLDWIITYYQVYRVSSAVQTNQKRLPVILWSGDSLFSGMIPKSGVLPTDSLGVLTTINSNWLRGFTCSKNSGNMYSIIITTPFHYGMSSDVRLRKSIASGDIEVSINPSSTSPINTYTAVYGRYDNTEIRVWFSNPSTPSTYIEQDFAITVRANRPIVQDEYLTPTLD